MVKNLRAIAGDAGLISGSGRSPGGGNSNPLQYSCLGNPMNRGAWWATVHGVARVGHKTLNNNLATKQKQWSKVLYYSLWIWFICHSERTCQASLSSVGKESSCSAGDPGLIPGLGRSSGEGIGYPLQYSWASLVGQLVKNLPAMWETWVQSLGWEDPLEKG